MKSLGLILACLLITAPVRAEAQEPDAVRVTEEGVLVDFQDADLRLVMTALAEAGGLNLIYSDLPQRRVTLRMKQPVPKENLLPLLRSIAQSNGLRLTEDGGFLRLDASGTPDTAKARDTIATTAQEEPRLFVYHLRHVRAAKLGSTLQALFGGAGGAPQERPGIREAPLSESLRTNPAPLGQPDTNRDEPEVRVDIGKAREPSLPGRLRGDVRIVPDETTNALLVRAQPSDWEIVRRTIAALDLRPLQALIEVLIVEVRRTSEKELSLSGTVADSKAEPTVRGTLKGSTSGDLVLEALRAGTLDVGLALSVLATRGTVRIVSRPVILAQNNQEARILIGSERPFVQVSRSLPTDAAVRDQVIQYRDVGTKLTLTPTINDDGYVNMQVLQEVSTATAETQFGAPVISTREASTYLFVKDGRTAVLGGLIDRQQEKTKSGIPVLMEIPLLGGLFGTSRTTSANSELFLFLTPHIVATDEDADRVRTGIEESAPLLRSALPAPESLVRPRDSRLPASPLQP
ncbi:MAG TPA: secretin N-terminal domain-containing protein [Gemmatimonadales bacterium]